MPMIGSVTMLRTVAEFSAATLPIPVSTIGKFCCFTVVAMTGTGGEGSGFAVEGVCAKYCHPRYPPEATTSIARPTSRGGRRPLLTAGLSDATSGVAIGSYFLIDCFPAERGLRAQCQQRASGRRDSCGPAVAP